MAVILVPAYQPDMALLNLVQTILATDPQQKLIILDDGSTQVQSREIFEQLKSLPNIALLQHSHNQGKGAALKTGIQYFLTHYPEECQGIVTADADGQHLPQDILQVAKALNKSQHIILGARQFDPNVPLRSRFGNILTRKVFDLFSKNNLQDTQTGLRGLSSDILKDILTIEENGYAFEMHMLMMAVEKKWLITEIPIATIYIEQNRRSHFDPLLDSLKIYFVFLRYSVISLLSAGLDFLLFFLGFYLSHSIVTSTVSARILSGLFNFTCAKKWIFKSNGQTVKEALHYISLALTSVLLSCLFVSFLYHRLHINIFWSKLTADSFIFAGNFIVQRFFIFKKINDTPSKLD